jgi:cytochrome d ubiquinol oxidase subunit II
VLIGLTALAALTHHGALWLAHRTDQSVEARAKRWALGLWPAVAVLAAAATGASFAVQADLAESVATRLWVIAFPAVAAIALAAAGLWQWRGRRDLAFTASSVFLYGMMGCAAAGIFPDALPARDPALSLTIQEAAAPERGLVIALFWWIPGMLIVCTYTGLFTYRMLPAKFTLVDALHPEG